MENQKVLEEATWYIIDCYKSFVDFDNQPVRSQLLKLGAAGANVKTKHKLSLAAEERAYSPILVDSVQDEEAPAVTRVKRKREAAVLLRPELKHRRVSQELLEKLDLRLLITDEVSGPTEAADRASNMTAYVNRTSLNTGIRPTFLGVRHSVSSGHTLSPISSASSLYSNSSAVETLAIEGAGNGLEAWLTSLARRAHVSDFSNFMHAWQDSCRKLEYNLELLQASVLAPTSQQCGLDDLKRLVSSVWIAVNQLSGQEPEKLERYLPKWGECALMTSKVTRAINSATDMVQVTQVPVYVYLDRLIQRPQRTGGNAVDKFAIDAHAFYPCLNQFFTERTSSWSPYLSEGFQLFGEQESQILHSARKWLLYVGVYALQQSRKDLWIIKSAPQPKVGTLSGGGRARVQLALSHMLHCIQFFVECAGASCIGSFEDGDAFAVFVEFAGVYIRQSLDLLTASQPVSDTQVIQTYDGVNECVSCLRSVRGKIQSNELKFMGTRESASSTPSSPVSAQPSAKRFCESLFSRQLSSLPPPHVHLLTQSLTDAYVHLLTEYNSRFKTSGKASNLSVKKSLILSHLISDLFLNIVNSIGNSSQISSGEELVSTVTQNQQ